MQLQKCNNATVWEFNPATLVLVSWHLPNQEGPTLLHCITIDNKFI